MPINSSWFYYMRMQLIIRGSDMNGIVLNVHRTLWMFLNGFMFLFTNCFQKDSVTCLIAFNSAFHLCTYQLSAFTIIANQNLPYWTLLSEFIFNFNHMHHWPFMVHNLRKSMALYCLNLYCLIFFLNSFICSRLVSEVHKDLFSVASSNGTLL